jgi:predicted DNA-binding ribbon-helix-helix protein
MCQIFTGADPELYRSRAHSLRLHGVATSIRLENLFWQVLEEIGARDGLTLNQLITRLHDELVEAGGDRANFTSFLRVCCGRYLLTRKADRRADRRADFSPPTSSGGLKPALQSPAFSGGLKPALQTTEARP